MGFLQLEMSMFRKFLKEKVLLGITGAFFSKILHIHLAELQSKPQSIVIGHLNQSAFFFAVKMF